MLPGVKRTKAHSNLITLIYLSIASASCIANEEALHDGVAGNLGEVQVEIAGGLDLGARTQPLEGCTVRSVIRIDDF